jgi:hypothetical protein
LATVIACGDEFEVGPEGTVVGASCVDEGDCADGSFCIVDGDLPGGTCSVECSSHADCPDGSWCISSKGGTCLLACESAADCRQGYACEEESDEGSEGKSLVCIDD